MDNPVMEIVKIIVAAMVGGGLWGLISWRLKKKKLRTEVAGQQYREMEDIVDSFITQMGDMSDRITKLQQENLQLREEILAQQKEKLSNEHGTET